MFDKIKFANILNKINNLYDTMTEFAKKSEVNRTYLSQYINLKLDNPPTPKILTKIANASHGLVSYEQLMNICGYMDTIYSDPNFVNILNTLEEELGKKTKTALNNVVHFSLNSQENSIYNDLLEIIPIYKYIDLSPEELDIELRSYFNNMDYISANSKDKILKKLKLYIEYYRCVEEKARQIDFLKNNSTNKKINNDFEIKLSFLPIYGQISAGEPNWAEECLEGQLPIDPNLMEISNPNEYFFLRVSGESMNNVIKNGAFALIHKQDMVDDGEIAVVLVNGFDATLKKFTKKGDVVVLEPDSSDPTFKTQIYDKSTPIKILGKYVGKMEINK